jgi:hypothetical protein
MDGFIAGFIVLETDHRFIRIYCTNCGRSFDVPRPCKNRFCEICSRTRNRKVKAKLRLIVGSLKKINLYKCRHMVLTVTNTADLEGTARHLIKSFRRLRQRTWFKSKVTGGAFVLEVTGSPGNWHVHIHCILHCRFLDVYRLSEIWHECSEGRIVYVKNLPVKAIINYLCKYLSKNGAPEGHQLEVSKAFKGLRLFNTFGDWHSICKDLPKVPYCCPICDGDCFVTSGRIQTQFNALHDHRPSPPLYSGMRSPP